MNLSLDEGDDGEDESPLIIRKRKGMTKVGKQAATDEEKHVQT